MWESRSESLRPVIRKKAKQEIRGSPLGTVVISQRGSSPRDLMARADCVHIGVEGAGPRASLGSAAQHRCDAQGDLAGHGGEPARCVRLPNGFLSLLGA